MEALEKRFNVGAMVICLTPPAGAVNADNKLQRRVKLADLLEFRFFWPTFFLLPFLDLFLVCLFGIGLVFYNAELLGSINP